MKPRLLLLPAALLCVSVLILWPRPAPADPPQPSPSRVAPAPRHATTIVPPARPEITTGAKAYDGGAVSVACSVCHSSREPNPTNRAADLDAFHQGLSFAHGKVNCLSCHDARNYDRLHLADGAPLAFEATMDLCGQCHGPQRRDYEHGAHGGMRGYWDLTRGGRTRNHCVDCHDPHAPAYPKVRPVFPPLKDNH